MRGNRARGGLRASRLAANDRAEAEVGAEGELALPMERIRASRAEAAARRSRFVLLDTDFEVAPRFRNHCASSTRVGERSRPPALWSCYSLGSACAADSPGFIAEQVRALDRRAPCRGGKEVPDPAGVGVLLTATAEFAGAARPRRLIRPILDLDQRVGAGDREGGGVLVTIAQDRQRPLSGGLRGAGALEDGRAAVLLGWLSLPARYTSGDGAVIRSSSR
jgi:hypothetical protein